MNAVPGSPWFEWFETVAVAALVAGCTLYCVLALAPASWVRALKAALLRLPLPGRVRGRLQASLATRSGCGDGCAGCSSAASAKPARRLRE